nr:hypothetical protein [Tanacetum cinerariifolium]
MEPKEDPKEVIPPVVASPPRSPPISPPPPLSESLSHSNSAAPFNTNGTFLVPPPGSTFERGDAELSARVELAEVSATLAAIDQDRIKRELFSMRVWLSMLQFKLMRRGAEEVHPTESINVLAVYEDAQHLEPRGPPDGSQ